MKAILEWLRSIFKKQEAVKPPVPEVVVAPKPPPRGVTFSEALRTTAVIFATRDLWWRESNGKNRSPEIDAVNKAVGVPLGSPYCKSGLWVRVIDATCKEWGLVNPVRRDASSQSMLRLAPSKFVKAAGVLPKKGDVGILTNRIDKTHGHIYLVREDATDPKSHLTIEYNTNSKGSRDGEGVHELTRSTLGTAGQSFSAYVDWVQWVIEVNGLDPNAIAMKKFSP